MSPTAGRTVLSPWGGVTAPVLVLVRLRRGVVGERARVVHIVPFPATGEVPESLTAYCGGARPARQVAGYRRKRAKPARLGGTGSG
ncbi:hypothetical protein GTS_47910 [Gandjariella thermophila]|uniref:Uncharacterized protein n=1 Tax=Gandjariella thermophila TaxID=1931992 RepID=A0A4D4JET0_9PSEU|nr:hypothetical protein GTS_47910 [Gandjariella thermophila]